MSWAKVKKINSDLSTPLDYVIPLQDIGKNQYNSYVFKERNLLNTLAINTTELYDVLEDLSEIRTKLGSRWKNVISNSKNLGYVLNKLDVSGRHNIIPNGNIDKILSVFSTDIYECIDEKDMKEILTYVDNKLDSNQVGKWIDEVFQLNSRDIASCRSITEVIENRDIKLVLGNLNACCILTMSKYSEIIMNIQGFEFDIIKTIKNSFNISKAVESISFNDSLIKIALTDEDVVKAIFNSIDGIKNIMTKRLISDKIKNNKKILTTIFDNCPDFVINFILEEESGYYKEKMDDVCYKINNNVNKITDIINELYINNIKGNSYSSVRSYLLNLNLYENYFNKNEDIKMDMKEAYLSLINSADLITSRYIDEVIIKSKYADKYLEKSGGIFRLIISENPNLLNKLSKDLSLLESLVNIDSDIVGNELSNHEKYSGLLDEEGAKRIFQEGYAFKYLINNSVWLELLMSNQEDYSFILDIKKLRSIIKNSELAMNRIAGELAEHMNYLTHCTEETMKYFKDHPSIYDKSMTSAKMLMGLSGQDSTNINSIWDITLEQFEKILNNPLSETYIAEYSDYKLTVLLDRGDVYDYLFVNRDGYIHLAKIASVYSGDNSYILSHDEFAYRICNNVNLFKEVIKANYLNLYKEDIFIDKFKQSDVACTAFWDMAKDEAYSIQISYIISDQATISNILKSYSYNFIDKFINAMDHIPKDIYKVIYSSKDMFKVIYSDAYNLSDLLKNNTASDILVTEFNEVLQDNVEEIMEEVIFSSSLTEGERKFKEIKEDTLMGEGLFYNDVYKDKKVVFFVLAGIVDSDEEKLLVYHGYKSDYELIESDNDKDINYVANIYGKYNETNRYTVTYGGVLCSSTSEGKCKVLGFEIL